MMSLNLRNATDGEVLRLQMIQRHLKIDVDPWDEEFDVAVIKSVVRRIRPILKAEEPASGDELIEALALHFGVHFETVRSEADIHRLQRHYMSRDELGFAVLDREFSDPKVDALLFQLENPSEFASHVAILNLREYSDHEFWSKIHELSHRLGEPPQKTLPFRRHPAERLSPVEQLIDSLTSEIGFGDTYFQPIVARHARHNRNLTISVVEAIRAEWAPNASFLAVANAATKFWPCPSMVLVAKVRGRIKNGKETREDEALRVDIHGHNTLATNIGMVPKLNWRVPHTSPLFAAFHEKRRVEDIECLGDWKTSRGGSLPPIQVVTSAKRFGLRAYAIISSEIVAA